MIDFTKVSLNCVPDRRDKRDYEFKPSRARLISKSKKLTLPKKVNWKTWLTPIKDQGADGCHDDKTEILTNRGWKRFKDISRTELVATINPHSMCIEFQKPTAYIDRKYKGKMIKVNGRNLDFMVTPNHRMWVRKWNQMQRKLSNNYIFVQAGKLGWYSGLAHSLKWKGSDNDVYKFKNWYNDKRDGLKLPMTVWVAIMGLYISEGCLNLQKGDYRVEIAASNNGRNKGKIRKLLDGLPFHIREYSDRFVIGNKALYKEIELYMSHNYAPKKFVPDFIKYLDSDYINTFLNWYGVGDGHVYKGGRVAYYTSSKHLADDILELVLKTGNWGSITSRYRIKGGTIKGRTIISRKKQFTISNYVKKGLSIEAKKKVKEVDYDGRIYCLEVPNGLLLTRRNGRCLVSGNSCVGFGTVALREFMYIYSGIKNHKITDVIDLSERFVYEEAKKRDYWAGEDYSGTSVKAGMKTLHKLGACEERLWEYKNNKPSRGHRKNAKKYRIKGYERVPFSIKALKYALVETPVVIGINTPESMFHMRDSYVKKTSNLSGGHCMLAVGYRGKWIELRNSWGCYDDKTEILTKDGWKYLYEVEKGEEVATLNPKSHHLEYNRVNKKFKYDYNGDLLHYKSRDVDLLVTPNHKIYFRNPTSNEWILKEADEVNIKHFEMKKNSKWNGKDVSYHRVGEKEIPMDLWLEFLGYFLSEGHTTKNEHIRKPRLKKSKYKIKGEQIRDAETGKFIMSEKSKDIEKECLSFVNKCKETSWITGISQEKDKAKVDKIVKCLDKLPWKFTKHNCTWITNNKDIYQELQIFGKSWQKYIPDYVKELSTRQLVILFNALMLGNGSGEPLRKYTYYTSSYRLANDVQELLLKIGLAGDITFSNRIGRETSNGVTNHIEYKVGIKTKELTPKKVGGWIPNYVRYRGKIHSVDVNNHIIYVRRNGKATWSGNSNWANAGYCYIDEKFLDDIIFSAWRPL